MTRGVLAHHSVYFADRRRVVRQLMHGENPKRVLEVGCGTGLWLSYLDGRFEMVGIDVRRESLEIARKISDSMLVEASATSLPFRSNSFELILAIDVIEHVHEETAMISELARILAPKGFAIVTTLDKNRIGYIRKMEFSDHLREYTETELVERFELYGFNLVAKERFYSPLVTVLREIEWFLSGIRLAGPLATFCCGNLARLVASFRNNGSGGGIAIKVQAPAFKEKLKAAGISSETAQRNEN